MAIEIIKDDEHQVMYCNTQMQAFGPVFEIDEDVRGFLNWLDDDPRRLKENCLRESVHEWREWCEGK